MKGTKLAKIGTYMIPDTTINRSTEITCLYLAQSFQGMYNVLIAFFKIILKIILKPRIPNAQMSQRILKKLVLCAWGFEKS